MANSTNAKVTTTMMMKTELIIFTNTNNMTVMYIQKRSVPLHLLRLRAPPQVKSNLSSSDKSTCDSDSDCSDADLGIPDQASVRLSIIDGKPGLQVNTKCRRSWTPIAARTRAKLKSN